VIYLSARETARNSDIQLSDESIPGFQLAGLPTVRGTLRQVNGDDSLKDVDMVYSYLSDGSEKISFQRSAEDLYNALCCLKVEGKKPLVWGAYLFYGNSISDPFVFCNHWDKLCVPGFVPR